MTASDFAKKNGFIGAREIKPWRRKRCFEAVYNKGSDIPLIGFPQIIAYDGNYRFLTYDEAMAYVKEVRE